MAKRTTKTARKTISKTKKTSAGKASRGIASKAVPAQPSDPVYRVFRWDAGLRQSLKESRETAGLTNQKFIEQAVMVQLPRLVEELAKLGISVEDRSSLAPVRAPMIAATLKALRIASSWTNLPQNLLLEACLRLATREGARSQKRRAVKRK